MTGVSEATVSFALMLFGVATVIGNLLGGKLSDRIGEIPALGIILIGLITSLLVLTLTVGHTTSLFVNLFIWGVFAFGISPIVQSGVVKIAEIEAPDAVGTASGFNIAAFNLGISGASMIGGILVDGPGILATPWAAAALVAIALVIVAWLSRQRRARAGVA